MKHHFTVSIDYLHGTTTGVSVADRSATVRALVDPKAQANDFARPGHIFPLRAMEGGVLRRAGHTEAVVDLCQLAGLYPAGVLCEILAEDGTMARVPQLLKIAEQFNLKIITVRALIEYRIRREKLVQRIVSTNLPSQYGEFRIYLFQKSDGQQRSYCIGQRRHLTGETDTCSCSFGMFDR